MVISRYRFIALLSVQVLGFVLALFLLWLSYLEPEQITPRLHNAVAERVAAIPRDLRGSLALEPDRDAALYATTLDGMNTNLFYFGLLNDVVLGLMIFALVKRHWGDGWHMITLSLLVSGCTLWAAQGYFFNPNWGMTLLFHDWAALIYMIIMVLVSLILVDWLFWRGLITDLIGHFIVEVIVSPFN